MLNWTTGHRYTAFNPDTARSAVVYPSGDGWSWIWLVVDEKNPANVMAGMEDTPEEAKEAAGKAVCRTPPEWSPLEMVDAVYDLVCIFEPESEAQRSWKQTWLKQARAFGAGPM